ncbi:MAG: WYL domain-containing protein [Sphingobacteriales bacterium]|nr:MAG: WYL domain-containing protein [Sphingobacteriales bacterium]
MNRIDRLFGISTLLQSRKFTPVQVIADAYQISIRTVYRDIRALCEQGIPICFEQAKGYHLMEGYFLPPITFTTTEATALLLVEKLTSGFADRSIRNEYSSVLGKIKAVMKPSQKTRMEKVTDQIIFQLPKRLTQDYEYLAALQEAAADQMILDIDYSNQKNEASVRRIECIGLIFYAFGWHAIAWCHNRKEYRDFKVERITRIRRLQIPFTKHDHIQISDYMKELPVDY